MRYSTQTIGERSFAAVLSVSDNEVMCIFKALTPSPILCVVSFITGVLGAERCRFPALSTHSQTAT